MSYAHPQKNQLNITSIYQDKKGNLWLGTFANGLLFFNAKDKEFTYSFYAGAKHYFNENTYLGAKYTYSTINGLTDKNNVQYDDIDSHAGSILIGFEF